MMMMMMMMMMMTHKKCATFYTVYPYNFVNTALLLNAFLRRAFTYDGGDGGDATSSPTRVVALPYTQLCRRTRLDTWQDTISM